MIQKYIKFVLEGTSPLIMNNPSLFIGDNRPGRTKHIPEEEAEKRTYRDGDGDLAAPVVWPRASLLFTGKGIPVKGPSGKGRASALFNFLRGGVFDPDDTEFFKLVDRNGDPIKDYEVFITPVVIGSSRVPCARPRIHDWRLYCHYVFFPEIVNALDVKQGIEEAGIRAGIGDNRPSSPKKPGRHGRFVVHDFEVVDEITPADVKELKRKVA